MPHACFTEASCPLLCAPSMWLAVADLALALGWSTGSGAAAATPPAPDSRLAGALALRCAYGSAASSCLSDLLRAWLGALLAACLPSVGLR